MTDDGTYAVTDPGSGIANAAWSDAVPERSEEQCHVKGTAPTDRACICTFPRRSIPCRGTFSFGTVPCSQAHKNKGDMRCKEQKKPLKIIDPVPNDSGVIVLALNAEKTFESRTKPSGAEADTWWSLDGRQEQQGEIAT